MDGYWWGVYFTGPVSLEECEFRKDLIRMDSMPDVCGTLTLNEHYGDIEMNRCNL